jgi:hypothetical protein
MTQIFDIEELKSRPLISLTAAENSAVLVDAFLTAHKIANQAETKSNEPRLLYGLPGLRTLLNCSHVTAQRIKNSGKLAGCYSQINRKIVFDEAKVLKALESQKKGVKA